MKDAYYFPHDSNAHDDPKISKMFLAFDSAVGYGIYWVIIEMMRNEPSYKLKVCDYDAIAYKSHSGIEQVEDLVEGYDLFKFDEKHEFFWSESFINRMKHIDERREKNRHSAYTRWHPDATALQSHSKGNASKVKESKVKETYTKEFEHFWSVYPRREGKGLASSIFCRLPLEDGLLDKIISAVEIQKKSDQWTKNGGQYIPMPATWLNQRRWEDEGITIPQKRKSGPTLIGAL